MAGQYTLTGFLLPRQIAADRLAEVESNVSKKATRYVCLTLSKRGELIVIGAAERRLAMADEIKRGHDYAACCLCENLTRRG